jgi:hypothetical protein
MVRLSQKLRALFKLCVLVILVTGSVLTLPT